MEMNSPGVDKLGPSSYRTVTRGNPNKPLLGGRRVRNRAVGVSVRNRETVRIGVGSAPFVFDYNAKFAAEQQTTIDENHGNFHGLLDSIREYERSTGRKLTTHADVGGPFSTTKYDYRDGGRNVDLHVGTPSTTIERTFRGRLQAYSYDAPVWPSIDPVDQVALWAYGNKARSLIDPTQKVTNVAVGAGELREVQGIPAIPGLAALKERTRILRGLGREYLNIEFGWKPLERDVRAAALTAKKSIQLLRQYEKQRGQAIRRRFDFPESRTINVVDMGTKSPAPTISSSFYDTFNGRLTRTEEFTQKVWFSGSFTYYITPGMSPGKMQAYEAAANRLLGSRLTPDLIWQLTPWTWLTDWFVDFGSLIRNLEAMVLDGSVMWYGYVMASQVKSNTYSLSGSRLNDGTPLNLEQQFTAVTKQRVRATPFGFGLSPQTDLSMKQWSILAALGITRV
jgi:hypothetical protein